MSSSIIESCLIATSATIDQAERAAIAVHEPDAIEILVLTQAAMLVKWGCGVDSARREAEEIVLSVLQDLSRAGMQDVKISVALRRAKVYRLRHQNLTNQTVADRLGICPAQAKKDYKAEMARRKRVA